MEAQLVDSNASTPRKGKDETDAEEELEIREIVKLVNDFQSKKPMLSHVKEHPFENEASEAIETFDREA